MKRLIILGFLIVALGNVLAQRGPGFTISPNPVCVGEPVIITNTSTGSYESYYWSFCAADPFDLPVVEAIDLGSNPLNLPVFIALALDNGSYFALVVNHYDPGHITRINFGENILNPDPEVDNIYGMLSPNPEGVQIVHNNDNWYAFFVGGKIEFDNNNAFFRRLDFGNSLSNDPSHHILSHNDELFFPHDLYVFKDEFSNDWWGLTVNKGASGNPDITDGSITRFYFGNDIENNNPGVQNLGNFDILKDPVGIFPIKEDNKWYVFVTDRHAGLIRLDFGNSLINTPLAQSISTGGILTKPRDISLLRYCDQILGFIVDGEQHNNSHLVRLDFQNGIESTPVAEKLTEIGYSFSFPHSISDLIRADDQTFALITNVGFNNIVRVFFPSCEDEIPSQIMYEFGHPYPVTYSLPGVYNIELIVNLGEADQANFCQEIIVNLPTAEFELLDDTICDGNQAQIHIHFNGIPPWEFSYSDGNQTWNHQDIYDNPYSIYVAPNVTTTYLITYVADNLCVGQPVDAPVTVEVIPKDDAGFTFPSGIFCRNSPPVLPTVNLEGGVFSATPPGLSIDSLTGEIIPEGSNEGTYDVTYAVNEVCTNSLTIQINISDEVLAHFYYLQEGFCRWDENPFPQFEENSYPGVFSSFPDGLAINPLSGEILTLDSEPGIYWVYNEILEAAGCPYEIDSTQVEIFHFPLPAFTSDTVCLGELSTLTDHSTIAEGSVESWAWYYNDELIGTGNIIQYTFPDYGLHHVRLEAFSDNYCVNDTIMEVYVKALPEIDLLRRIPSDWSISANRDTVYACIYNSVTLDAGGPDHLFRIFEWSVGADTDTLTIGALGIGYELQYHHVSVTDTVTGCVNTAEIFIEFSIAACEIGIYEPNVPGSIKIFPNPANDFLIIQIDNTESIEYLELLSVFGQVLEVIDLCHNEIDFEINISLKGIIPGVYLIRVLGTDLIRSYKFIVSP